jgi:hemin uptake protein HemP
MSRRGDQEKEDGDVQERGESRATLGEGALRMVRARDLLGAERVLRIEHEGQVYTLRITRNDRLILTK